MGWPRRVRWWRNANADFAAADSIVVIEIAGLSRKVDRSAPAVNQVAIGAVGLVGILDDRLADLALGIIARSRRGVCHRMIWARHDYFSALPPALGAKRCGARRDRRKGAIPVATPGAVLMLPLVVVTRYRCRSRRSRGSAQHRAGVF